MAVYCNKKLKVHFFSFSFKVEMVIFDKLNIMEPLRGSSNLYTHLFNQRDPSLIYLKPIAYEKYGGWMSEGSSGIKMISC
jgi:hypothetical protein